MLDLSTIQFLISLPASVIYLLLSKKEEIRTSNQAQQISNSDSIPG